MKKEKEKKRKRNKKGAVAPFVLGISEKRIFGK
ncbi:hypothetical protein X924_02520 [Petrotoga sp. 9PWA.NaAc.5.4]|nr:hypothetical protein X924_02520 [Petrotoga sp. 9PWA.NaAc.5.4]